MARLIISAFILLASLFYSCQSSSTSKRQALKLSMGSDPESLDPRRIRGLSAMTLVRMLYEGLTRLDPESRPTLALAESVEVSNDSKTYTFHLRSSQWTNGDALTAEDFVYAWKKVLDPSFPSDNAYQLFVVKNAREIKQGKLSSEELGVKALDVNTLEVQLHSPCPYFLELVAFPVFFPIHQKIDQSNPNWAKRPESYIGNGPFKIREWKHDDILIVVKNERYWDAQTVKLPEVHLLVIDQNTEVKLFEKKELDWLGSPMSMIPVDAIQDLKKKGTLRISPLLGTYFLRTNVDKPPFNHPLFRKALAVAIDRKAIIDHILQGGQGVATGLVPNQMGLQVDPFFADGNIQEARALFEQYLKESHRTVENLPEIVLTYRGVDRNHLIAQALQQQWFEAFHFLIKLESIEGKIYFDRLSKQDYQITTGSWIADFNDPVNFLEVFKFKVASTNNTQWEDEEYQRLLDQSYQQSDLDMRRRLLSRCEKILLRAMPIIPIFEYTMLYVNSDEVKDIALSKLGHLDFKWAYLEEQK